MESKQQILFFSFFFLLFPSRSPSRRSTKRLFPRFNHRAGLSSFDRLVSLAAYSPSVRYTCFSNHETITVPPIHFVLFCCVLVIGARLTGRGAFHETITSFSSLCRRSHHLPSRLVPVSFSPRSFRSDCFREFSGRFPLIAKGGVLDPGASTKPKKQKKKRYIYIYIYR